MNVEVLPVAARELKNVKSWYDTQRFGLGRDLIDEVRTAVERIVPDPTSWSEIEPHYRRVPVQRFPYSVIFRVEDVQNTIVIVAFAHVSRRQGYWRSRWRSRKEWTWNGWRRVGRRVPVHRDLAPAAERART